MMLFWFGVLTGFPLGCVAAIAWSHYLALLYDPRLPTVSEEADEYVRAHPHWPKDGGP